MRPLVSLLALVLLASPAFSQSPKGRKVAFLVGVGKYRFNFSDLGAAPERDVTELGRVLADAGFDVVTLTGSETGPRQATKANVEGRFKALLTGGGDREKALGKDDLVLVHLCGHGFQAEAADPATGKKSEQPFYCPVDAMPDKPDTMVPLNALIRDTEQHKLKALFLVDACREIADPNRGVRGGIQGNKVTLQQKTAVLFACSQGQLSHQSDLAGGGHGLFTFAVLKSFRRQLAAGGKVRWSQVIADVEEAFESDEFKRMLPGGRTQTPVEAKGELGSTLLADDPVAKDWAEMMKATVYGGTPPRLYYKKAAPPRLATWKKAAERGVPNAMILYGDALMFGAGEPTDEAAAVRWYQKAADAGSAAAKNQLGVAVFNGLGRVKQDAAAALRLWTEGAEAGCVRAMVNAGTAHFHGDGTAANPRKAVEWYRKAADGGSCHALSLLGESYLTGRGVEQDPRKAAELFRKASDLGLPQGMLLYGQLRMGLVPESGVATDKQDALRLFRAAADLEYADADFVLAKLYLTGQGGVQQDPVEGKRLMQKAADGGSAAARAELKK